MVWDAVFVFNAQHLVFGNGVGLSVGVYACCKSTTHTVDVFTPF